MKKGEVVSVRFSEEIYGKLKKYADEHGESISDVCRQAIEVFLGGIPMPSPPSREILEIKKRLDELNLAHEETRNYVWELACWLNQIQVVLNQLPIFPQPPWRSF